jgi:hypothetical protein
MHICKTPFGEMIGWIIPQSRVWLILRFYFLVAGLRYKFLASVQT